MGSAKFGRRGLAENDGAGFAQRPHGRIVAFRKIAAKSLAAHLSGHILGFEQVLDANRHTVDGGEGAPILPACGTFVSGRAGANLIQDDEGFDDRLAFFDRLDASLKVGAGTVGALPKAGHRSMEGERLEGSRVVAWGWVWVHGAASWEVTDPTRRSVAASSVLWAGRSCHHIQVAELAAAFRGRRKASAGCAVTSSRSRNVMPHYQPAATQYGDRHDLGYPDPPRHPHRRKRPPGHHWRYRSIRGPHCSARSFAGWGREQAHRCRLPHRHAWIHPRQVRVRLCPADQSKR